MIKANETELLKQQLRMLNVKISEQEELFKDFENSIKEIKETKHNLRHQLLLIKEYIDTDDKEHLLEYLDKIQYPLSKNIGPALCKNRTANAVISHYVKIAQEESIEVSLNLQLPEVMNICDEDLCVIFGNCLENAVEACRRMKSGQRYIHLSALYKGNFLAITLDNSFDGKIIKKDNTFFSRKREHEEGIGISTIRSVVRKYNGMAEFKYSQNQFETSIFLNCQSNQHSQMTICRTQNTYS
ncbi:MAG: ATP-binding protein [[Clostridium] cellulosi]